MRASILLLLIGCGGAGGTKEGDAAATPDHAGCETFCAKGAQCDPQALNPAQCLEGCVATVSPACRTCVTESTCESIQAGGCDSACG